MGSPAVEHPVATESSTTDLREAEGSRRRLRVAAPVAIVLVVLAAIAAVVLSSRSSPPKAAGAGVPAGETTTEVTRRTLTESSTVDGTLGYSGSSELYDRLASAGTFTWLPAVGAVIGRDGTLFRVDNLPVALMYGGVPAYRTLKEGVSDGPDVEELNQNLILLGYDPYRAIDDYDHFGEATAAAVRRWQKAEGLSQTGEVELGRIVFAAGAQRVTKVHVALGQDPPGDSSSTEPGSKGPAAKEPGAEEKAAKEKAAEKAAEEKAAKEKSSKEGAAKERERASKEKSRKEPSKEKSKEPASNSKEPTSKEKSPSKEKAKESEEKPSKESASKGPSSNEPGASGGGAGTLVLGTTSTQQVVQLKVKASQQQLAHLGERAPVTLPDGEVVHGHITSVGTVASESSESEKGGGGGNGGGGGGNGGGGNGGGGENATISVTLTLDHPVARLDQAPVSVELVKNIRRDVLTVPATALVATAGGGYAIEALEGNRRFEVPVTPGMFANGNVQIEGAGVREGLTVIESQ